MVPAFVYPTARATAAAALVMLALPGSAYIYQGEELGLPEHTTLPDEARQDPSFFRTGGAERGRDGCRVPLPWVASAPGFGFGPYPDASGDDGGTAGSGGAVSSGRPWLPQPASFARYAADRQVGVPGSTYELYRDLLALRSEHALGRGGLEWAAPHDPEAGILAFRNGPVLVVANMGAAPVKMPQGWRPAVSSRDDAVADGALEPDACVWMLAERD